MARIADAIYKDLHSPNRAGITLYQLYLESNTSRKYYKKLALCSDAVRRVDAMIRNGELKGHSKGKKTLSQWYYKWVLLLKKKL